MSMPPVDVDEFAARLRLGIGKTSWLRLSDEEKLELFVSATTRWSAGNELKKAHP